MKFDLISDEFGRIEYFPIPETDSEKSFCEEVNAIVGAFTMLALRVEYEKNGPIDPFASFRPYIDNAWEKYMTLINKCFPDL